MSAPIIIENRTEAARGCGYRKPGGKYLVSGGVAMPCGKLPIELCVCPTCGGGIKPSRGWTWVDADALGVSNQCVREDGYCNACPLSGAMGRAGMLWVGEKFYATPGAWTSEALRLGVSRRIHQVPNDFEVGKTWVLMAHRKTIDKGACPACNGTGHKQIGAAAGKPKKCGECDEGKLYAPGIFHAFMPTAIEYVVTDRETPEELEKLVKRGFTLVRVHRDDGQPLIGDDEEGGEE